MAHHAGPHDKSHPSSRQYVIIGAILAILTAMEFGVFLIEGVNPAFMVSVLLALSFAKFIMVVGYFMHLKFDSRMFTYLFFFPFVIMVSIVVALLAMFHNLTR